MSKAILFQHPSAPVVLSDQVQVALDVDPWLTLTPEPLDGAKEASVYRALCAQRKDRLAALETDAEEAAEELRMSQYTDSLYADAVAKAMHGTDLSQASRRQAGAVAVRLHNPKWQVISRYRAAKGVEMVLRNLLSAHGLSSMIPDQALREASDRAAGTARQAWFQALTGTLPVHLWEWSRARLGFLSITEDK